MAQQQYIAKSGTKYTSPQNTPITEEEKAQIEAYDAQLNARPALKPPSPSDKPVTPGSPVVQAAGPLGMLMTPEGRKTIGETVSSTWEWAKAHPAQAGAMVAGMVTAPFTGGASLAESMALVGGASAVGATGGLTTEKIRTGQPWTTQDIAPVVTEGVAGALGAGFPMAAEKAFVSPAARLLASQRQPVIQATAQAAEQRSAAAQLTNALEKYILPESAKDVVGNQQELQSVISETAPYVAEYFKSRPDALGKTVTQRVMGKFAGVDKSKVLAKDMVNTMSDAYTDAIAKLEQALGNAVKTRGLRDITSNFNPAEQVISDVRAIKRTGVDKQAIDVLKTYKFIDAKGRPKAMTYEQLDQARKQLNADMDQMLSSMTSPDRALAERTQANFRAMNTLARAIRDYEYQWLSNLGITDVAQMRQLESKLMDARRMFRSLTHKGESTVYMPVTPAQQALSVAKTSLPIAAGSGLAAGAFGGASTGIGTGIGTGILSAGYQTRRMMSQPGETTLNKALAQVIKEYLPKAESAAFPSWEFGATVPRGYIPAQTAQERVIVPPAPEDVSGPQPFDYTAGAPSGTFTRPGYAVSEKATPLPTRPQAPPPNIPPVTSGYGPAQARELGAQTRVPGGAFEPSAITFGGRTAEQVLPSTAEAGIRLGNIRGDYQTMKLAYPDMPDVSNNGRFKVTLPSGDVVRFSTKNAQQNAQRFVDQFIREFGR